VIRGLEGLKGEGKGIEDAPSSKDSSRTWDGKKEAVIIRYGARSSCTAMELNYHEVMVGEGGDKVFLHYRLVG